MIIYRYLGKQIYTVMFAVTGVLIGIIVCHQFVHYLRHAFGDHLPMVLITKLALLQIPSLSGYILPLGFYLGVLLSYGRMYSESEMTVLFSCGMSRLKLILMTLSYASLVTVLVAALTFWVQPKLFMYQGELIYTAKTKSALQMLPPGVFQKISKRWVFYTKSIGRDRKAMHGVFAARLPKTVHDKWQLVVAESAKQIPSDDNGADLILQKGHQYFGEPGSPEYNQVGFGQFGLHINPKQFSQRELEKHETYLSTKRLWRDRHKSHRAVAELQLRLAIPLSVLVLTLIAIPLSRVRHRSVKNVQLLPAILFYALYMNLIFVARTWLKSGSVTPFLGMWWVHGVMLGICIGLNFNLLKLLNLSLRGRVASEAIQEL